VVNATLQPLRPGKETGYPILRRLVGPRTGMEEWEKPPITGIQYLDQAAFSDSLYRLRYSCTLP